MRSIFSLDTFLPGALLSFIVFACFILPLARALPAPVGGNVIAANQPALSPGHLLGTDMNGNDVLARLAYGGRSSLQIAIAVNLVGLFIGGSIGALAGYARGLLEAFLVRVLDVFIAVPSLVLVIAIAQALGPSELNTIGALSLFSVPSFARVARAGTLKIRGRPFMTAAQISGTSHVRTLIQHVAPNIAAQLCVFGLLGIGIVVMLEGALSFLGLGVPPPNPSWGNMIADGQRAFLTKPSSVFLPTALLFLTVLSVNLLAQGVHRRFVR